MMLGSNKPLLGKGFKFFLAGFLIAGCLLISVVVQAAEPAETTPAAVSETAPVEKGDYNTGRILFTGEKVFQNGGPPCISCHSAGLGKLDGGLLGPNLTKVYADPAKQALLNVAWVNSPGIPVMGPIFSNKNITEDEMNHLKAFFKTASEKEVAPSSTGKFTLISLLGSVGVLVFFSIVWSKRYSKRNQNTAHDALWRNYGGKGGR